MSRLLAGALALFLLSCEAAGNNDKAGPTAPSAALHIITGLPLFFGEGFSLEAAKNPVVARLEQDFTLVPVDGPEQLPPGGLLLAAQPRAMTASRLVALDRWVRDGGRLLLLADPWLTWPSDLPLGTPGRPPVEFADTGLLGRWGLALVRPAEPGPRTGAIAGREVLLDSPGTLAVTGPGCRVDAGGLVARCRLGRGQATVIADADILQVGSSAGLDGPTDNNLPTLVAELHDLSPR